MASLSNGTTGTIASCVRTCGGQAPSRVLNERRPSCDLRGLCQGHEDTDRLKHGHRRARPVNEGLRTNGWIVHPAPLRKARVGHQLAP